MGGEDTGSRWQRLLENGILEGSELALWHGNQERLENYNRLSQASVEIIVVGVYLIPHFFGIQRHPLGQVIGSVAVILTKIFDHLLQGADFMEELQSLGKQHMVEQAAHTRRTLAAVALKIGGIERRGVRNCAVVFGMLGQSPKQASKRLGQESAEPGSNTHRLQRLAWLAQMPKLDSFVERHAQHDVTGLQPLDLFIEYLCFGFWKTRAPVVFDRLAASKGAVAVFHERSPRGQVREYNKVFLESQFIFFLLGI